LREKNVAVTKKSTLYPVSWSLRGNGGQNVDAPHVFGRAIGAGLVARQDVCSAAKRAGHAAHSAYSDIQIVHKLNSMKSDIRGTQLSGQGFELGRMISTVKASIHIHGFAIDG